MYQVIWLRNLLEKLSYPQCEATLLHCDNNKTVNFTHDSHSHLCIKHIDIQAHFIRNQANNEIINVVRILGKENPVDVLTKVLSCILHKNILQMLSVVAGQRGCQTLSHLHCLNGKEGSDPLW